MKKTIITVALIGAFALALGVSGYAYAQGNQPPDFPSERAGRFADRSQSKMDSGNFAVVMHDALAEFLGMTPEELTALHESGTTMQTLLDERGLTFEAFHALMDDVRAAAVADGILPEGKNGSMADRRDHQGDFNRRDGGYRSMNSMQGPLDQEVIAPYMHTALAEILGVSVDDLDALHDSGDTIQTLLDQHGLTLEEFGPLMAEARASAVAAALADGVITQEGADLMLGRLANFDGMGARQSFKR